MRFTVLRLCAFASTFLFGVGADAADSKTIPSSAVPPGPARQIMRFSDGRLIGSIPDQARSPKIFGLRGTDLAESVQSSLGEVKNITSLTSDSNSNGTYVLAATRTGDLNIMLYRDALKAPNAFETIVSKT